MPTPHSAASPSGPVLIHGAGAIGLYLGGRLAAAGTPVQLLARPSVADALRGGLTLHALDGGCVELESRRFTVRTTLADLPTPPALVLLTVKGTATATAGAELAAALPDGTPVVSFQNGVDNPDRLRRTAPRLRVLAGMVPFNVVRRAPNAVQQTTGGELAIEDGDVARRWAPQFAAAGLPLARHRDMRAVQWGKLLLNLNNPLNALAGVPLLEQLESRDWRRLLAALQDEALRALHAARIRPARATPLPSGWLPTLLRLPTPLFRRLARRMLTIRPDARLSMYADRVAGRATEVDDLCGAVLRLAQANGLDAPLNRRIAELIEQTPAERFFDASELNALLARPPG